MSTNYILICSFSNAEHSQILVNITHIVARSATRFPILCFFYIFFSFFSPAAGRRLAGTASRRLCFEFSNPYNSPYTPFAPFTPPTPARRDVAHNKRRVICSRIPPFLPFSSALSTRRIALPTRGKRIGPSKHFSIPLRLFRPLVKYFSHTVSAIRYSSVLFLCLMFV